MTSDEIEAKIAQLNDQLAKAKKFKEKKSLKKAIKNYQKLLKQSDKKDIKMEKQETKQQKIAVKQSLADQGIDPNAGVTKAVSDGIAVVGQVIGKAQDNKAMSLGNRNANDRNVRTQNTIKSLGAQPMILVVLGLVGVVFAFFMFNKKK